MCRTCAESAERRKPVTKAFGEGVECSRHSSFMFILCGLCLDCACQVLWQILWNINLFIYFIEKLYRFIYCLSLYFINNIGVLNRISNSKWHYQTKILYLREMPNLRRWDQFMLSLDKLKCKFFSFMLI